jgi:hypothetical protein
VVERGLNTARNAADITHDITMPSFDDVMRRHDLMMMSPQNPS